MAAERNPSPPRLSAEEKELIEGDKVGDTLFSKKWVLKTLMKIVEHVNSQNDEDGIENRGAADHDQTCATGATQEGQNLDDDFDAELCELWDMSMNEVSPYLITLSSN